MKHRNDLKLNIDKEAKKGTVLKRILITGILVLLSVFVLNKAENYLREKSDNQINLILNNRNVTSNLKHEIIEEDGNVYL